MSDQILWTAVVTPFDEGGAQVDYPSLERVLRTQEKASNGVVLLGSTGEGLSLGDHERRCLVEFVMGLGLQTQIMVGVPSYNLGTALEWLKFCKDFPFYGYLMTTPLYTKPGVMGQTKWFEKLLEHAHKKAMLYNIPGRAATKLQPEALKNLAEHEKLWAIKDSSGTVDSLVDYRLAVPHISIFCGDDYLMKACAALGAQGLVSIASNVWPEHTRRYVKKSLSGSHFNYEVWWQTGKAFSSASNPIPVKALLKDLGLISSDHVRLPLSSADLPDRKTLLDIHEKIIAWAHHE